RTDLFSPGRRLRAPHRDVQAYGVAIGDYDKDGKLDIFLACQGPDHLFHNDGGGVFTDVTSTAGVAGLRDDFSGSGLWVDANDDGLPDLFVSDYIGDTSRMDLCNDPRANSRLFLNLGDGTFADVTTESGTNNCGAAFTAAAADLDEDGVLELYVAND